jgi:hypothetical protein
MGNLKRTSIHGCDNVRDSSGEWVKSWMVKTDDSHECRYTRLGNLWNAMVERCNPNSFVGRAAPSYSDVSNGFGSFKTFSDWAVMQPGFDVIEDSGKRYALDKDLLIAGNRVYSGDACCFVPQRINNLFILPRAPKEFPLGVSWEADRKVYGASISIDGRNKRLGRFQSPDLAHCAWQKAKAAEIERLMDWYQQAPGFSDRVLLAMGSRAEKLYADIHLSVQTVVL